MWALLSLQMRPGFNRPGMAESPRRGSPSEGFQILCPGNRALLDFEGKPRYSQYGEIQMDLCRGPVGPTGSIEFKAQSSNDPVEFPLSHSQTTAKQALLLPTDTSGKSKRKLDMSPSGSGSTSLSETM